MDHILYWNNVALEANRRDFSNIPGTNVSKPEQGGPTLSSRALAIIHLAMYDAHAGVIGNVSLPLYLAAPPASAFSAADKPLAAPAAVAAAAHSCLSKLYPRQKAHFDAAHQMAGLSGSASLLAKAHAYGLKVAQTILADREKDPSPSDDGYAASMHHGAHRPDPANPSQGYHAPFYGARSKLFATAIRHALASPSTLSPAEHNQALKQVRGKGIAAELMGTLPSTYSKRTVDETLIGLFWSYDGSREIGTPPRFYNQIVREIALQKNNTIDQNARLFALINAAMGDAGILAWEQKYIHDFWRPVVGIREHDPSMGPAAVTPQNNIDNDCDPEWLPLSAPASNSYVAATDNTPQRADRNFTPPFPAYPSGHATFGAAALHMTRLFYGKSPGDYNNDTIFVGPLVSDELNGVTRDNAGNVRPRHVRSFPNGLWQMIVENGLSRIYLGVHWSFDAFAMTAGAPDPARNIGGVPLGLKIAEDVYGAGSQHTPVKPPMMP